MSRPIDIANRIAVEPAHPTAVLAIAEDLVRQAVPFDTPERRAIVEDAQRAAFRPADDPGVIPRFIA